MRHDVQRQIRCPAQDTIERDGQTITVQCSTVINHIPGHKHRAEWYDAARNYQTHSWTDTDERRR